MEGLLPTQASTYVFVLLTTAIVVCLTMGFILVHPAWPRIAAYYCFRAVSRQRILLRTAYWPFIESGNFIFRYQPGTDPEDARLVLATAEAVLEPVKRLLGNGPVGRIPLIVYKDREALREGFGWGPEENAMGVYWAGVIRILSPQDWIIGTPEQRALVFQTQGPVAHELAHSLVDYQACGNYPRWLTEGIAQRVERSVAGFVYAPVEEEREGHWYSLKALEYSFDQLLNQTLAYRESLLLTDYLASSFGTGSLNGLLHALGGGYTLDRALSIAAGISGQDLEYGFRQWVEPASLSKTGKQTAGFAGATAFPACS